MIGKVAKKILRAAIAQPWDYVGEGAPNEWEFRLNPDEETVAVYSPLSGQWTIFREVVILAVVGDLREMDRNTGDWSRYVEETDPDD